MDRFTKNVLKVFAAYVILFVTFLVFFKTVLLLNYIPSGSMEGTIKVGDMIISTTYDTDSDELERYDILTFTKPEDPDISYIKRLIGMPGETIEVRDGKVYADGVELDDSFVKMPMNRRGDGIYHVPEGCYFFLGDNRNDSYDSRYWTEKYIPAENITSKAKFRVFPFTRMGSIVYADSLAESATEMRSESSKQQTPGQVLVECLRNLK